MTLQHFLEATGWTGLLIVVLNLVMLVVFLVHLARRQFTWVLLWLGGTCVVLGILGTTVGMVVAYNVVSSKGGTANPTDLSSGMADALLNSVLGWTSALPALTLTGILRLARRDPQPPSPEDPPAAESE
jgi:hypothetical protein